MRSGAQNQQWLPGILSRQADCRMIHAMVCAVATTTAPTGTSSSVSTAEAVDIQQSASGGAHRQPAPRPEQGADGRQAS